MCFFYRFSYELLNDKEQALDWYQQLLHYVPSDPSLLNKLSDIADADRDKQQAFSHLTEVIIAPKFMAHLPAHVIMIYM